MIKPKWTSESVGEYERSLKPPSVHSNIHQSTWVGLTPNEINELVDNEDWYNDPHGFARIVEAKVKEKNDAS